MMTSLSSILLLCIVVVAHATIVLLPTSAQLSAGFYNKLCPQALPAIRRVVQLAVFREPRMGASLLRMHFHDCFVNGCDGSILLDDTSTFRGEKTAFPNVNSVRGFEVIDDIKNAVDNACHGNVVSCADILAVAARDSIYYLDGPFYPVLLGRRDARNASWDDANASLPPPFFNFTQLLSNFQAQGLNLKDLVVLSAAHTIGLAHCFLFRDRIYNDSNIDPNFAASVRQNCPSSGGDFNTQPLDATTRRFDMVYFRSLLRQRGLLHSDQELYKNNGGESNKLVEKYSIDPLAFARDFSDSMIKMGNIKSLTGNNGEVRFNCRKIN